jgi:hypothetical protein
VINFKNVAHSKQTLENGENSPNLATLLTTTAVDKSNLWTIFPFISYQPK